MAKGARFRGCNADSWPWNPVRRGSTGGQGTPDPSKETPGRGFESSEPPAGNRRWTPALSLTQIFRSHTRAHTRASAYARGASGWPRDYRLHERGSPREAVQVLPSEMGVGFQCEASTQRPTTMRSHPQNFFG